MANKSDTSISHSNSSNLESKILFIVGPTASGKSKLAMELARLVDGEIICADSQTLHRNLDIGTAKPTQSERAEIPHHMLDLIGPYERYSAALFKARAEQCILDITARGKVPIVVGGSGMYIDSLYFNYDLDATEPAVKAELSNLSVGALQEIIKSNGYPMPKNDKNPRHLATVIARKGKIANNSVPRNGALIVGLDLSDVELKDRISRRVNEMFSSGLVEEVRALVQNHGKPPAKLDANAYPIVMRYIQGELSESEAQAACIRADWQYARKQKMWFKRNHTIYWCTDNEQAIEYVSNKLFTA